jgi:hypothetical protein
LIPRQFVHFPIDAATGRSNGATAFTPARLDKPLRLTGAVKTAKAQWGRTVVAIALADEPWLRALDARQRFDAC